MTGSGITTTNPGGHVVPAQSASAQSHDQVTAPQAADAKEPEQSADIPATDIQPTKSDAAGAPATEEVLAEKLAAEEVPAEKAPAGAAPAEKVPAGAAPVVAAPAGAAPAVAAPAVAAPAEAPPSSAQGWRAPGLDGVRALAVLSVLAFHEGLSWIPGGFLGVDVFFVLSGYLITDLLVTRFRNDGRVGLRTFWQRRARRLLPALALMLVTVTAAVAVFEPGQSAALRPALVSAVTYTSNWWQALARQSYFTLYGPPPPFEHLWSLAVEEQFYLLWPLILAVVLAAMHRPALRALVAWAGALASALIMFAIYVPKSDPSLVYYGTDTHASALMVGAALALTWPLAKVAAAAEPVRRRLDVIGAVGLAVLGWAVWHFSGADPLVYPFGLVLAAIAAGGLVLAATAPGRIGTILSWAPLRWLGVRSYGIYLWHWPVIAIMTGMYVRAASTFPFRVMAAVLPIALAAASWRWLEEPVLRNGLRAELRRRGELLRRAATAGWRTPAAAVPLTAALALLALACTAGYGIVHPQTGPTLQAQIEAGLHVSANSRGQAADGNSAGPGYDWWQRPSAATFLVAARPRPAARPPRVSGSRVQAIGDSVMLAAAPELAQTLPGIYINAQVSRAMIAGIGIVQRLADTHRLRPVLIVGLGTNGPITSWQINQLRTAIGRSRWLILVNTFVPRPWEHEVNATLAAASRDPNVLLVNWHAAIEHHTSLLWSDGIHPQPIGGKLYAKVVRAVVARALSARPPSPLRRGIVARVVARLLLEAIGIRLP
jgi:peptidoglycan/LPS O-acetylase OafA/YrhL